MRNLQQQWKKLAALCAAAFLTVSAIVVFAFDTFADPPPPALTISSLGTNQWYIGITNGVSTNNYELHWIPSLSSDSPYPWTMISVGSVGQTNWSFGCDWPQSFFRVSIEQFYNGIPDFAWADPNNPALGALTITIDFPTNNAVLQ